MNGIDVVVGLVEYNKNHDKLGKFSSGPNISHLDSLANGKTRIRVTTTDGKVYEGSTSNDSKSDSVVLTSPDGNVSGSVWTKDIAKVEEIGKVKDEDKGIKSLQHTAGGYGGYLDDEAAQYISSGEYGKGVRERLEKGLSENYDDKGFYTSVKSKEKLAEAEKKYLKAQEELDAVDYLNNPDDFKIKEKALNDLSKEYDDAFQEHFKDIGDNDVSREVYAERFILKELQNSESERKGAGKMYDPEKVYMKFVPSQEDASRGEWQFDSSSKYAKGAEWIKNVVSSPFRNSVSPEVVEKEEDLAGGRAHYLVPRTESGGGTIVLSGKEGSGVLVHEYGHHLEYAVPGLHQAAVSFLEKRVRGYVPEKMSSITGNEFYHDTELSVKDNFSNAYMGKIYLREGKVDATELISMGLEGLYVNPLNFMRKEPELFDMVVTAIKMNRRPKK